MRERSKPTVTLYVRIPPEVKQQIDAIANRIGGRLSATVTEVLRLGVVALRTKRRRVAPSVRRAPSKSRRR